MLRDLVIRHSYRSDEDDIIQDFYIPCLSVSTLYQRAVGFYSSSSLSVAAKGLHTFVRGGGRMQLIASPYLFPEDIDEIHKGYAAREVVEERAVLRAFDEVVSLIEQERLGLLAWLIQYGRLDVKIAVVEDLTNFGIYHEKLGVFSDGEDFVAFTGSPNESSSGLISNFESIDVFCSWKPHDYERAAEKQKNFQKLWDNQTKRLRVYSFPEAARRRLLKYRQDKVPERDPEQQLKEGVSVVPAGCPRVPASIHMRPYQLGAIQNWVKNNGRGTFKMATGSGKTITSLATAARLYDLVGLQALIVVVPYRHLVSQWSTVCERFGLNPIKCFESRRQWSERLRAQLYSLSSGAQPFLTVITTNASFASTAFQSTLRFFPKKTMIIGDEAHNLGSGHHLAILPETIRFRLALSATPERWFDDEGTEGVYQYFGSVLQPEFTLRDALDQGALTPYRYYPVFVEFTDEEAEEYADLTRKIGRIIAAGVKENRAEPGPLTSLLNRRARLIGSAQNKLTELKRIMQGRLDTAHTLFYCGDGTVEEPASRETMRHLDAVCRLLGSELNYRVDSYTAETPIEEREDLRLRFERGELQGIVAIRCLDEGVDIPLIKTAFILASSTNPRQFIQRRGRVLRPHPDKKIAEIFDFIVIPPEMPDSDLTVERALLRRELARYVEFADLAQNAGEVRGQLVDLQRRFSLLSL